MNRLVKTVIGVFVVGAVGLGLAYWFLVHEDSPKQLSVDCPSVGGASGSGAASGDLTGTWKVTTSTAAGDALLTDNAPGPWVGYRIDEDLQAVHQTAVGRTSKVTGQVVVDAQAVKTATFDVDMTALASSKGQRDNRMKSAGLETDKFPSANFALTQPVPVRNGSVCQQVQAVSTLTFHGQTKPVTMPLTVSSAGGSFLVRGRLPIALADYAVSPPNIGGFVTVEDKGTLEVNLVLAR